MLLDMGGEAVSKYREAARAIRSADALLVCAGAGMGVDSGLPDFRGNEGFWRAYPPYRHLGLSFSSLASPRWFDEDPAFAWGFYGHRLALYRKTIPHEGFALLRSLGVSKRAGAFVFTSNVDGQFQRAGFDDACIVECHGAIDFLQCARRACGDIFPADDFAPEVDATTFRLTNAPPRCKRCGGIARPNVLMFGDGAWDHARTTAQERRLGEWLRGLDDARLVVVEIGAGKAIPTVRSFGESLVKRSSARLVRINPREPDVPEGQLGFDGGAVETLKRLVG